MRQFWKEQFDLAVKEEDDKNLIQKYFSYKRFISFSNGRGKSKRKSRNVELLTIKHSGKTIAVKDVPTGRLDVYAREALGETVADDDDHFQIVIDYFRSNFQRKK